MKPWAALSLCWVGLVGCAGLPTMQDSGKAVKTGNTLDLFINGRGFFPVRKSDGQMLYSREGEFKLNDVGGIVTQSGDPVDPPVSVPKGSTNLVIRGDGTVFVTLPTSSGQQIVGSIRLAVFPNPPGLIPVGGNQYQATPLAGRASIAQPGLDGAGSLTQGEKLGN